MKRHNSFSKIMKNRSLLIMLVPAFLYYIIFHYFPMYGLQIAFKTYKFNLGVLGSPWVGLNNFKELFSAPSFGKIFRNTILISTYKLIFSFPAPIIFAILLNEIGNKYFKKVTQTISYLPHFISWVILAGIFGQFLSPTMGPVGQLFKFMGKKPIFFLGNAKYFRTILVTTSIWKSFGWSSIVYLAGIANIDGSLIEAAVIDGANRFKCITHITIPSLMPIVTLMLILSTGSIVSDDFDQIFNLINPAVSEVGEVLSTYIYKRGLTNMEFSFATAVGLFQNIISFTLIFAANAIAGRISEYSIW